MRKLFISNFFVVVFWLSLAFIFSFTHLVFASETNGTIDATDKYAFGENIGWINFGCDNCDVAITDAGLTGYAWSTQFGWINLNPTTSGVANTSAGVLSGLAWSSNLGWIDFDGVTINASGEFLGYATLESNSSQINFNCVNGDSCASADFKVKTDWRPASARTVATGGSSGSIPRIFQTVIINPIETVVDNIVDTVSETFFSISDFLTDSLANFFKPKDKFAIVTEVPEITPLPFHTRWNLLPVEAIRSFVFAPLPYEVRILARKFPALDKTFKDTGVERFSDLDKLSGVTLNAPKIALIKGLPIAEFSNAEKRNLPTEFVFARANAELVDLNVALSFSNKGEVTQTISSLPGKTLRLVVKPTSSARSVTGYIVFKSATPKITQNAISRSSLTASVLFSMDGLVQNTLQAVPVERELVLSSFEYTDPDRDGIYTADVMLPVTPGEYEIITIIDYIDPVLGARQIRMITVIDPEGYVFEKNNGKETRIPSAIVSLYYLNTATKKYELWKAENYQQENPQITDIRGTYAFLVPQGSYYFTVEAPGYKLYQGKVFDVLEGNGIHQNIELTSSRSWFYNFGWSEVFLLGILLLLVYNLYHKILQDRLLKVINKNDA